MLLLGMPAAAETLEGEGFRLAVPEGFVRAGDEDEAEVHAHFVHTYRSASERSLTAGDVRVQVFVRAGPDGTQERLVVSRAAVQLGPADDAGFLRGQRGALDRTVEEMHGKVVRHGARELMSGLLVSESVLEGDVPDLGPGTIHGLVLPRQGSVLNLVLTQRAEPGRDPEDAWSRLLASLRSREPPPRAWGRRSGPPSAVATGRILAVVLPAVLVLWIVRRLRRARREADAEADGPAPGPGPEV